MEPWPGACRECAVPLYGELPRGEPRYPPNCAGHRVRRCSVAPRLPSEGGGAQLVLTPRTPDMQETLLSGCARRVDCVYPVQATY